MRICEYCKGEVVDGAAASSCPHCAAHLDPLDTLSSSHATDRAAQSAEGPSRQSLVRHTAVQLAIAFVAIYVVGMLLGGMQEEPILAAAVILAGAAAYVVYRLLKT